MTPDEEKRLLREVHENNIMLRSLIEYLNIQVSTKGQKEFGLDLVTSILNLLGNKIT